MSLVRPILRPLFELLPKTLASHTLDLDFVGTESVDPRITFTRASTAMRTNSAGVLESVAINTPRIDYDPVTLLCRGLMVEDGATNLLTYSDGIGTTPWSMIRCSVISATAYGAAPMFKIVEDTSASTTHSIGRVSAGSVSWVSGKTYTFSILVKKSERDGVRLSLSAGAFGTNIYAQFNLLTGGVVLKSDAITAHAKYLGADLWRLGVTATATATSTAPIYVFLARDAGATLSYTGDGSSGIYVGAPQVEEGAKMSSYIPTVATAMTRSAEVASITGADFSDWYNATEGTFVAAFDAPTAVVDSTAYAVNNGTQNEQIDFRALPAGCGGRVRKSGADEVSTSQTPLPADGLVLYSAFAYAEDNTVAALQGAVSAVDTSCLMPAGIDRLEIGSRVAGAFLNGHIHRLTYFPTRLSNSTLQMITRAP